MWQTNSQTPSLVGGVRCPAARVLPLRPIVHLSRPFIIARERDPAECRQWPTASCLRHQPEVTGGIGLGPVLHGTQKKKIAMKNDVYAMSSFIATVSGIAYVQLQSGACIHQH